MFIYIQASNSFVSKSGLTEFPQVLMNGVPMDKKYLTEDTFEEGVVATILAQTPALQKAVYQGTLHDFVNIQEWLMERDNVLPRLNSRVLTPGKKTLDFTVRLGRLLTVEGFKSMCNLVPLRESVSGKDEII